MWKLEEKDSRYRGKRTLWALRETRSLKNGTKGILWRFIRKELYEYWAE